MGFNVKELEAMLKSTNKEHERIANQLKVGNDYYYNCTDINKTGAAAIAEVNEYLLKLGKNPLKSANNKISANWHRILTDQKIGYLFTFPPQFDVKDDDDKIVDKITECLGDCYEEIIKQLGVDASNSGIAWLTYWYESKGVFKQKSEFNYYFVNSEQVRPIYDQTGLKPKLTAVIRTYVVDGTEEKQTTKYEVWSDKDVTYFDKSATGAPVQGKIVPHTYGEVPFIAFKNNAAGIGDLTMYKALIDAVDKLLSGFANDIDDLQEIIWVIKHYSGEQNEMDYDTNGNLIKKEISLLQKLKAEKFISVDGDGAVDTIRGEVPYEARSKFLSILIEQLFISAMAVNPNPEKTGQASGVYIKFLYSLLELKAGLMETKFRPSLNQLIRAILKYLNADSKIKIEQKWTRNRPTNDIEIVNMISQTPNTVLSDESKTKEHPLTENWQTEREQIAKEQRALADNMFNIGGDG